jgi:hypothetical protein
MILNFHFGWRLAILLGKLSKNCLEELLWEFSPSLMNFIGHKILSSIEGELCRAYSHWKVH